MSAVAGPFKRIAATSSSSGAQPSLGTGWITTNASASRATTETARQNPQNAIHGQRSG